MKSTKSLKGKSNLKLGFADFYFERQKDFQIKITAKPKGELKYIVVIPCYHEFEIHKTLDSIWNSKRPKFSIEVLIVINSSEDSHQEVLGQNIKTYNEVKNWIENHEDSSLRFFVVNEGNLPRKFAGAGLARKIGMDQAANRFNQIDNQNGFIVSLDADSRIRSDYFEEIEKHVLHYPKTNVFTIYFEHPIEGGEFNDSIYSAAATYELYLRYYKLALNYCGFPYSFYTVGSCFGVNAKAYVKQGGMNRKQAGEDFYFLHKVFPLGNCYEINSTCVYPSSRPSNRVPFGTGPMIKTITEQSGDFLTYNFEAFIELKSFLEKIQVLYRITDKNIHVFLNELTDSVSDFLIQNNFKESICEINQNSANLNTFTKRFFHWFDAFRILKYLNFSHEKYFSKNSLLNEAKRLFRLISDENLDEENYEGILEQYRKLERRF